MRARTMEGEKQREEKQNKTQVIGELWGYQFELR
jgi:hypothetical protein